MTESRDNVGRAKFYHIVSARDISLRWSRFTWAESAGIKDAASLAAQVSLSYGKDSVMAASDVKAWMVGRAF